MRAKEIREQRVTRLMLLYGMATALPEPELFLARKQIAESIYTQDPELREIMQLILEA